MTNKSSVPAIIAAVLGVVGTKRGFLDALEGGF